jgi:hypothetical protein
MWLQVAVPAMRAIPVTSVPITTLLMLILFLNALVEDKIWPGRLRKSSGEGSEVDKDMVERRVACGACDPCSW